MADVVSSAIRSRMMAGIRSKDTKPELIIRRGLHRLGFRFRLHRKAIPGNPDLVFPRHHAVLFVHGCFWHGHGCHLFKWPSTRVDFWKTKIQENKKRDCKAISALQETGWRIGVVWECAVKGRQKLSRDDVIATCADWLQSSQPNLEVKGADD